MLNKRIISLLLAFVLMVSALVSMSSCMYAVDILTNNNLSGSFSSPDDDTPPPATGTGSGGDNESSTEQSNAPTYYPGANNAYDIADINPKMKTLLSTVSINAKFDILSTYPSAETIKEYSSYGSGIIYKLDREAGNACIITNYHVVYNSGEVAENGFSDTISLYLYGMEGSQYAIPAKVIGGSMTYDIAVLEVRNSDVLKNSMAVSATLGNSDAIRVFDNIIVVGNPEGYGISATEGSVNVESESLNMVGADGRTGISLRVMRISAAVNEGNSGGGLYSDDGKLIGIVSAKRTGSDTDNIGYAIPINLAVGVAENILRNCDGVSSFSVKKGLIGITLIASASGLLTDGNGNLIIAERVSINSIEETCITDKIAVGDIINSITVDGNKTDATKVYHVTDKMLETKAGSIIILNITRGNETLDVSITLPETAVTVVK